MIIAISGFAGVGKDTVADFLVKHHGFVKIGFADELKRAVQSIYGFSDAQIWGPSDERAKPDTRFPRLKHTVSLLEDGAFTKFRCDCCGVDLEEDTGLSGPPCYLTPRYALQVFGTEAGRHCYPQTWVEFTFRVYQSLQEGGCYYDQKSGLRPMAEMDGVCTSKKHMVITDCRFKTEFVPVKERGKIIRLKRPDFEKPRWNHPSETEQMEIPDSDFHYILNNKGDLTKLQQNVDLMVKLLSE